MIHDEMFRGFESVSHRNDVRISLKCGHCEKNVYGWEVARYTDSNGHHIYFVVCSSCSHGSVIDRNGKTYPKSWQGENVKGLSAEVDKAYHEARNCMSINAYTSCQLICRKILEHIAVNKCGGNEMDAFENHIKKIESAGYITNPMKTLVDKIIKEGKSPSHMIPPPLEEHAKNMITFTAQLLKLVYEMEHVALSFSKTETKP